jgi:hypothetical protein
MEDNLIPQQGELQAEILEELEKVKNEPEMTEEGLLDFIKSSGDRILTDDSD